MSRNEQAKMLRDMAERQEKLAKYYARFSGLRAEYIGIIAALTAGAEALEAMSAKLGSASEEEK